jgi:hypothetical protein
MRQCIELPIRLDSVANLREHWAVRHKRAKAHRMAALAIKPHPLPCVVTITRIAPRRLDEHDNLPRACKALVDGIADRLGVKDNDTRVEWRYSQATSARPKHYACMVEITEVDFP